MQPDENLVRQRRSGADNDVSLPVTSSQIQAWWSLFRLRTTACAGLVTLLGFAADEPWPANPVRTAGLAMASALLAIAFGQVFNDIRDRDADAIAKPYRAIPSGAISVRQASIAAVACMLCSLVAAALAGLGMLILAAIMLLMGAGYSIWLKNSILSGNVTAALLSALTFLPRSAIAYSLHAVAIAGFALIFLYMLANELFKTAQDREGDLAAGITTIATAWGMRRTTVGIAICWAMLLCLLVTSALVLPHGPAFAAAAGPLIAVPTGASTVLALRSYAVHGSSLERAHRWWRASWTPGLAALCIYSMVR